MTDYGSKITSRKGNLQVGGKPYTELSYEDTLKAYNAMSAWRDNRGLTTKNSRAETAKLKAQADTLYPAYQMQRYQEMMAEYMGAMSEALNRQEAASEPLKQAQDAIGSAKADTDRKQLLRRGLASTFTRYGASGQKLGA